MRKLYSLLLLVLIAVSVYAQAPNKMSYQAVIRNSSNQLVTSHTVGMKISILQGSATSTAVYTETITPTPSTNANGLVSIEFGGGTEFNAIDWANGPYFIKTETDPTGGSNYTISGTSQFLSVPYALHAKTADNGFSGNYNDLSNKPTLFDGQYSSLTGTPSLSLIATSGSYNDLSNKPTLFSGSFTDLTSKPTTIAGYGITDAFNGAWASLTGKPTLFDGQYSNLTGAPSLSTIATSGSYNDLSNKPTLFGGNFADLTNRPTTLVGYGITDAFNGTWASLTGKPVLFDGQYSSLTGAPTKVSAFTNDAGYLTSYTETDPNSWSKTGNAGTTAGTNFIGTTDNKDLIFKVNNIVSGTISTAGNTSFGYGSLFKNISGTNNIALGNSSLVNNTNGSNNTSIGTYNLMANTSGGENTSVGFQSLNGNTVGTGNSAFGRGSLTANTTGNYNTVIGSQANVLYGYLSNATAIGYNAIVDANDKVQIGNSNVNRVALGTGTNVTLETGLVKITGGTPGAGKVLTSDATGLASWQAVPAADGSETKLNAGTNVTITGSGTTASPYVVNSTQTPGTQTGQMQYWNGSAWVTVASGSNGQILKYKNGVPTWSDENINVLSIGDPYQGGIIAYFLLPGDPGYDANIKHGIIAAPSNQSTGAEWGCSETTITGADGTALGTGNQNTIDIMAECATAGIAARLCGDLVLGGYSDWYLPSNDELNKLYLNRVAVGGFANFTYWSSTQLNSGSAWVQVFFDGTLGVIPKNSAGINVRAIRSF